FLTSACCAVVGLPDDCAELRTLRTFRDGWLAAQPGGRAEIFTYYAKAPGVAAQLMRTPQGRRDLLRLYWSTIVPCVLLVRLGLNRAAHAIYRRTMRRLLAC